MLPAQRHAHRVAGAVFRKTRGGMAGKIVKRGGKHRFGFLQCVHLRKQFPSAGKYRVTHFEFKRLILLPVGVCQHVQADHAVINPLFPMHGENREAQHRKRKKQQHSNYFFHPETPFVFCPKDSLHFAVLFTRKEIFSALDEKRKLC